LAGVGVVGDHEVAPRKRRLDVDLGACGGIARAMDRLAGPQQGLRRDARPVRALSSHELALHDRHAQTALGQTAPPALARRAPPEDYDVVVGAHEGSPSPAAADSKVAPVARRGRRVLISWRTQPLPSGSPKEAKEP